MKITRPWFGFALRTLPPSPARAIRAILACIGVCALNIASAGETATTPWTGEAGITESVASIMARERQAAVRGARPPQIKPWLRPDRRGLPQNPNSPLAPGTAPGAAFRPHDRGPFTSQAVSTSFTGATFADTSAFPPEAMGAAGPTQFVVAVNGRVRTFNKATGLADGALNASMNSFFASVTTPVGGSITGNNANEPRVRYDRLSGRWFIVVVDVPYTSASLVPNRVLIAVSSGSTITNSSSFTFFFFQHDLVTPTGDTNNFADYPTLGIDANALYIGDNVFTAAGAFSACSGFVVRKSSILGAGPIVATAFRGLVAGSGEGPFSPVGVDNYDPAATEGYFVGTSSTTFGRLIVRRVSNPGGSPTISGNLLVSVPATTFPITVPHLGNTGGTNGNLRALDDRLSAAHFRNGRLWTAHNIQVTAAGVASSIGGRNGTRWYELQNLNTTPSLAQSGTVFDPATTNPKSFWVPSIMVSGQGHAVMGFSTAGVANRANAGTAGRLADDAAGTMAGPVDYTASSTAYNPTFDSGGANGRRWGNISYTSLDPNDDMTMWTIQEFCDATNSYGLRVAQLLAPPPATPVSCSPASVSTEQASVNITVTGTPISGSGFFDPGVAFPNRLTATVSGGVSVNSVTYDSPTSVTLNISTTGAAAGPQGITITNPDGQSLTGDGILTVMGVGPVVTTTPGSLSYVENQAGTPIDSGLSVTDGASANIVSATVAITANFASGEDTLGFANQGGITGNYDAATGVLTLTGAATVANYQVALRTVSYANSSDNPSIAARTVAFTVNDGTTTGSGTRTVAVTAINDPPTFDAITDPAAINENAGVQTVNFTGVGSGGGEVQVLSVVAVSDNPGLIPNPSVTYTSPNASGSLSYSPASNQSGSALITVTVMDNGGTAGGGFDSGVRTFHVVVVDLNGAPSVVTGTAASITTNAAMLQGSVNPNGFATTAYFEYGATTAYGQTTATQNPGGGTSFVGITMPVNGLQPGTVYHFRLVGNNNVGTTLGGDATLTTAALPPLVTTGTATNLSSTGATLGGTVNPNGFVTAGYFEYGLTPAYGSTTAVQNFGNGISPTSVSVSASGLQPGTPQHFRLVATNAGGTVIGQDAVFTTNPAPPVVVTGEAIGVTATSATLQGTVNPNGQAAAGRFEYGLTTAYGSMSSLKNFGNGTSVVDVSALILGLQPGTLYHFRLVGSSSLGTTNGTDATFATPAAAPVVITGSALDIGSTVATFVGTVNPNGLETTAFFEYGRTTDYGQTATVAGILRGATAQPASVSITGLEIGVEYHYRLSATRSQVRVDGADATFRTSPPNAPVVAEDVIFHLGQVEFDPLRNDIDADPGDTASLLIDPVLVQQPTRGHATVSPDQKRITFTVQSPNAVDMLQYRAVDSHGAVSAPGTVQLLHLQQYKGFYQPLAPIASGSGMLLNIALDLSGTGAFSGVFSLSDTATGQTGSRQPITGDFKPYGQVIRTFTNEGSSLATTLEMNLSPDLQHRRIIGNLTILDGKTVVLTVPLDLPFVPNLNRPRSGRRSAFIDPPNATTVVFPGDGFLIMNIGKDPLHQARFVGRLPDAEPFSAGARPAGAHYGLNARLYRKGGKGGALRGQVDAFDFDGLLGAVLANLSWKKKGDVSSMYYPDPIDEEIFTQGLEYPQSAPGALVPIGLGTTLPNAIFRLSGGNLPEPAVDLPLSILPTKVEVVGDNSFQVKLQILPKQAMFKGRFIHPVTKQWVPFLGAFQASFAGVPGEGRGSFRGANQSGTVRISVRTNP